VAESHLVVSLSGKIHVTHVQDDIPPTGKYTVHIRTEDKGTMASITVLLRQHEEPIGRGRFRLKEMGNTT
jgi:hypothetical protein